MPFYEAVGRDSRSGQQRTLHISARSDEEAIFTAADRGISRIEVRPCTDREVLMMDLKCFLNAEPLGRAASRPAPVVSSQRPSAAQSMLFEHPILVITASMLAALSIDRLIDALTGML